MFVRTNALKGIHMIRISTAFFAIALAASTVAAAPPPPMPPGGQPEPGAPPPAGEPMTYPTAASAAATTNPALLALAKSWFAALQSGQVDRSQLAGGPYANLTDATIANAQKMIGNLGKPVSFVQQQVSTQGNTSAAIYLVTFKNGEQVDFLFAVNGQGKVTSLGLGTPH
jgi:hypothetical protein